MTPTDPAIAQLRTRRRRAGARAARVLRHLAHRGIEALVVGSLAEGRFGAWSDVDFLITSCPWDVKYNIEGDIMLIMQDIPFDTVYLEEARPRFLVRMQASAKTAREIVKAAA